MKPNRRIDNLIFWVFAIALLSGVTLALTYISAVISIYERTWIELALIAGVIAIGLSSIVSEAFKRFRDRD
jgi:uncharacterized membrane protein